VVRSATTFLQVAAKVKKKVKNKNLVVFSGLKMPYHFYIHCKGWAICPLGVIPEGTPEALLARIRNITYIQEPIPDFDPRYPGLKGLGHSTFCARLFGDPD
jgi:hypothetical protein